MAEERIARAYVEIVTRKSASFNEDVRRAGKDAGDASGKQAAASFDDQFTKESPARNTRAKFLGRSVGRHVGQEAGEKASAEMGQRLERDATAGRFVRAARAIGRRFGRDAGDEASKGFGSRLTAGRGFLAGAFGEEGKKSGEAFKKKFSSELASLKKGVGGFAAGLAGAAGGGAKALGGIGAGAAGLASLGSALPGIIGAVVSLSGVVGVLPGVFAAAGAASATFKIGIAGVSDAISNSSDPEAYAKALKDLAPSAQSFAKAVVGLKPAAKDIKQSVQGALFKGLAGDLRDLGRNYLPIAKIGLTGIAQGLNSAARDAADFLNLPWQQARIERIFNNISIATGIAGKALRPFLAALLSVVSVGSSFLPSLANSLANVAEKFSDFVTGAADDGSFTLWIRNGIDAVMQLGDTLGSIGRIVAGIFSAAGGGSGSGLGAFADLLGKVADQVNRPEFQTGLGAVFDSISKAGDAVGAALPSVADALVALQPAISNIVEAGGVGLGVVLQTAADAVIKLAPAAEDLTGILVDLAPHADKIAYAFAAWKVAQAGMKLGSLAGDALKLAKAVRTAAAAQGVLNLALTANPIGLTIVAVAGLAAGLFILWQKSQTAREIMSTAFAGIATVVLEWAKILLHEYKAVVDGVLTMVSTTLRALGKIPGNGWAKRAADDVDGFRASVDRGFDRAIAKTGEWQSAVNRLPKIVKLKGDIADLRSKIDDAKQRLKDPNLTNPQRSKIRAEISDLQAKVRAAKGQLASIKDKTVHVSIMEATFHKDYGSYGSGLGVLKASGGLIQGPGTATSDSIPARLSNGEYVVKASVVAQPGMLAALHRINAGQGAQGFATGGLVDTKDDILERIRKARLQAKLGSTAARLTTYVNDLAAGLSDITKKKSTKSSLLARIGAVQDRAEDLRLPAGHSASGRTGPSSGGSSSFSERADYEEMAQIIAAAVGREIRRSLKGLTVSLDEGTIAGAVVRAGGRL